MLAQVRDEIAPKDEWRTANGLCVLDIVLRVDDKCTVVSPTRYYNTHGKNWLTIIRASLHTDYVICRFVDLQQVSDIGRRYHYFLPDWIPGEVIEFGSDAYSWRWAGYFVRRFVSTSVFNDGYPVGTTYIVVRKAPTVA
jgi:hypothetical protein